MPTIPINYLAVVVAGVASFVLGFLWYGPLFGKQWIKMMKIPSEKVAAMKKKGMGPMVPQMLMALVASIVMSFVMAHSLIFASSYLGVYGISAGLQGAFWNWLGFMVPIVLSGTLWEGKSWNLFAFNAAYYLVSLAVIGSIISTWPAA
jgi:hypothetical protein